MSPDDSRNREIRPEITRDRGYEGGEAERWTLIRKDVQWSRRREAGEASLRTGVVIKYESTPQNRPRALVLDLHAGSRAACGPRRAARTKETGTRILLIS